MHFLVWNVSGTHANQYLKLITLTKALPLNSLLLFIVILVLKLPLLVACVQFISSVSCPLPVALCPGTSLGIFRGFFLEGVGKQISRNSIVLD